MKLAGPRLTARIFALWFGVAALAFALIMSLGLASASAAPPTESTVTISQQDDEESPYSFGGTMRDSEREPIVGVEVTVTANGFENSGTTDDFGSWRVGVPEPGTYTVTINVDTLPDGVQLRNPDHESREFELSTTVAQGVLFAFGDPGGTSTTPTTEPGGDGAPSDDPALTGDDETETISPPPAAGQSFMDGLTQRLINGFFFGLLLALGAIGITLIYGTTGISNFAHGELLTFGGVMLYATTTLWGLPLVAAIAVTLIACTALGWVHDAGLFKPLRKRRVGMVQLLIVTIGLSMAMRYFFQFLIGGGTQQVRINRGAAISIGPANISTSVLVAAGIAVLALLAVAYFLTQTRIGKATRAVSDNSALAATSGINVDKVIRIVWVGAGFLTGLAGLLYAYFIGGAIRWDTGFSIMLLLFAAVTLGGLGSAFGALVGALVIGIVTEVSTLWLPADIRYAVALLILILVLLVRPQGILGRKERVG